MEAVGRVKVGSSAQPAFNHPTRRNYSPTTTIKQISLKETHTVFQRYIPLIIIVMALFNGFGAATYLGSLADQADAPDNAAIIDFG